MVNTVAAPNRSPAPDESVADTTAAITKPAITGGMRLSATVATALFASMFGNSANATRPNTAGTKANRAMIIPQMMEPRTAVFSSFAAKYRCTDSWPVEKVMKYMIIRPMMVFQPTFVKPNCSGGNLVTTDSQPPTLCNTNGTARVKPPTRTKKWITSVIVTLHMPPDMV